MIKEAFRCPYCAASTAIDCGTGNVVFDPDGLSGDPCPHLACFWICLSFAESRRTKKRTRSWIWNFGREMRKVDILKNINDAAMTHYIIDLGFGTLAKDLLPTQSTFRIAGASAAEREERSPGSGELLVQISARRYRAILDGWGIYSQSPQELMNEIDRLSFEYEV